MSEFVPTVTISLEEYLGFKNKIEEAEQKAKEAEQITKDTYDKLCRYRNILYGKTNNMAEEEIIGTLISSIENGTCQAPTTIIDECGLNDPLKMRGISESNTHRLTLSFKIKEELK